MPELPEVETIARNLRPALVGRKVIATHLLWPRSLETPSPRPIPGSHHRADNP